MMFDTFFSGQFRSRLERQSWLDDSWGNRIRTRNFHHRGRTSIGSTSSWTQGKRLVQGSQTQILPATIYKKSPQNKQIFLRAEDRVFETPGLVYVSRIGPIIVPKILAYKTRIFEENFRFGQFLYFFSNQPYLI